MLQLLILSACLLTAIDLLRRMLDKDPSRRIDPKSALEHKYFASLDEQFGEDLIVPDDSPTGISQSIKRLTRE